MSLLLRRILFIFFIVLLAGFFTVHAQEVAGGSGSKFEVEKIPLRKDGKKVIIAFENAPLNVIVFLSPECPLCKNYSIVLNALQEKYKREVKVYGIVPGRSYTNKEVQQYVKDYKINFPVYIDPDKELSTYTKATVTPEVILINKEGSLVYRGAIDDWVQDLGKKKVKPQQYYLEDAIAYYLQGQQVLVKNTMPKGCLINEF